MNVMRCILTVYHFILDCFFCVPHPLNNGSIEQKQMTLAKYCNSLQTELGPIYTSSHSNCLLIQLQKFCYVCLTLMGCTSSFPMQYFLPNCQFPSFCILSPSNCPSKINYSFSLQDVPWLFNSLSTHKPLFFFDCFFHISVSLCNRSLQNLK